MPRELATTFLTISRHEAPPVAADISRALASAMLGVADYQPAPPRPDGSPPPSGRRRIGTHTLKIGGTQASVRILVFQHENAVTTGMGEAAFNALTRGASPEDVRTLREGTISLDLRLTTPEEQALLALEWAMRAIGVLLDLTQGATIDPAAQRCLGRADLAGLTASDPLAHIAVHSEPWGAESLWMHTHGLQKFGRPEVDLAGVPLSLESEGRAFLEDIAGDLARGSQIVAGSEIDLDEVGGMTAIGAPADIDHQAPYGRLRLADVPLPGERQQTTAVRLVKRMALATASRSADSGNIPAALENIERVLGADPDDCAALALKAQLYLRLGHPVDALDVGELMELRAPGDHRGPLAVGTALAALGRNREALNAINRAIDLEPEAADAFAVRAIVHEQLGHEQLAAVDRARAAYLKV